MNHLDTERTAPRPGVQSDPSGSRRRYKYGHPFRGCPSSKDESWIQDTAIRDQTWPPMDQMSGSIRASMIIREGAGDSMSGQTTPPATASIPSTLSTTLKGIAGKRSGTLSMGRRFAASALQLRPASIELMMQTCTSLLAGDTCLQSSHTLITTPLPQSRLPPESGRLNVTIGLVLHHGRSVVKDTPTGGLARTGRGTALHARTRITVRGGRCVRHLPDTIGVWTTSHTLSTTPTLAARVTGT